MSTVLQANVPIGHYWGAANVAAKEYRHWDNVKLKLGQQRAQLERYHVELPPHMVEWHDAQDKELERWKATCVKRVLAEWRYHPVSTLASETLGIGPMLMVVLSLCPPIEGFANPAKLWKYVGLHPDRATDRRYNKATKAWLLFRLAEPCIKKRESPYRTVYDARRVSRPEMLPPGNCPTCDAAYTKRKETQKAGWDCHNMGGPHYKAAHAYVDALGVTAKAILLDAWRATNGMEPKHGVL
jgi:hypothetical protein